MQIRFYVCFKNLQCKALKKLQNHPSWTSFGLIVSKKEPSEVETLLSGTKIGSFTVTHSYFQSCLLIFIEFYSSLNWYIKVIFFKLKKIWSNQQLSFAIEATLLWTYRNAAITPMMFCVSVAIEPTAIRVLFPSIPARFSSLFSLQTHTHTRFKVYND